MKVKITIGSLSFGKCYFQNIGLLFIADEEDEVILNHSCRY